MPRLDPAASARRLARKAREAAEALKAEYEAGRRGDDSPTTPIFPTPAEQLEALRRLLPARAGRAPHTPATPGDGGAGSPDGPGPGVEVVPAAEVEVVDLGGSDEAEVAAALRGIDWQQVRTATAERTGDAARAMRTMAANVDWATVQPVAAQVSSALIAAVASGRMPIAGRLGPLVAKALTDQGALAQRVGQRLTATATDLPPDFRDAVQG